MGNSWAKARRWTLVLLTVAAVVAVYHQSIVHYGRSAVASYFADSASDLLQSGDIPGALAAVDRALAWLPGDAALVYLRAQIHAADENWEASLADYSQVTNELAPNFAAAYVKRAEIHRDTANFHSALDDLERAIELSPATDPGLLNDRAYVRALAGDDLPAALEDIELAMAEFHEQDRHQSRPAHLPFEFIDTRGYIRFRLGQHKSALEDIERALRTLDVEREKLLRKLTEQRMQPGEIMRAYDKVQAEILFHRGLVREALGETTLAEEDFALAKDLGYTQIEAGP